MIPSQLQIGTRSPSQLLKEIEKEGMYVSDYGKEMIDKIKKPKKETVDLVVVTVKDLGFDKEATTDEIFDAAKKRGYKLCHPIVGLELRLKYEDQPKNEWIYIGMEQINCSGGNPSVFCVLHDEGGLWLGDRWAEPAHRWVPGGRFLFVLRESDPLKLSPSLPLSIFDSLMKELNQHSAMRYLQALYATENDEKRKGVIQKVIDLLPKSL